MIQLGYNTWRYLGLSVALGYAGLGGFALAAPTQAAKYYFGWDVKSLKEKGEGGESKDASREDIVKTVLPLMGARDLSIFTALMVFFHNRQHSEMGVLILSGTILCAADIAAIWLWKGPVL